MNQGIFLVKPFCEAEESFRQFVYNLYKISNEILTTETVVPIGESNKYFLCFGKHLNIKKAKYVILVIQNITYIKQIENTLKFREKEIHAHLIRAIENDSPSELLRLKEKIFKRDSDKDEEFINYSDIDSRLVALTNQIHELMKKDTNTGVFTFRIYNILRNKILLALGVVFLIILEVFLGYFSDYTDKILPTLEPIDNPDNPESQ